MKEKDIEKLTKPLRKEKVTHQLLAKFRDGISLSSIANGDDLYDFFQVVANQDPVVLDIMQSVIDSRRKPHKNMDVN